MKGLRWGRILKDLLLKRNGGLELAKQVAYDTVGGANPVNHVALEHLVDPGQIRFGSNFPWQSEDSVEASIRFWEDAWTGLPEAAAQAQVMGE
jgi:hypothetical protein